MFGSLIKKIKKKFDIPKYKECIKAFDAILTKICIEEGIELIRCDSYKELNEKYESKNSLGLYITCKVETRDYWTGELLDRYEKKPKIIILKKAHSLQREPVFTLAHELGHHFEAKKKNTVIEDRDRISYPVSKRYNDVQNAIKKKTKEEEEKIADGYVLKLARENLSRHYFKNFDFNFYTSWYSKSQYKGTMTFKMFENIKK